ncbi:protein kinase domain-containing protein [Pendulispora albinea]|uniref:Serine/threonine protein kinase n=1 Tax=Pendulispora albinea TaxID=2741071 RepID=A0ABZ2MBC1_9BACT
MRYLKPDDPRAEGADVSGEVFGNYRALERIGHGGMAAVYLAEHVSIGGKFAVKVLRTELASDPDATARLLNEARASAAIQHPGIVQVFDVGALPGGALYIVMEYLEGRDLRAHLARQGPLQEGVVIEIARQVASALHAAHVQGVVHRDLKPDNIFLVPQLSARMGLQVKVLDFGIAKIANQSGHVTQSGALLGTVSYMSPEQLEDSARVDARTDVYSLGCVMFEMAAGQPPFSAPGKGDLEILTSILQSPFPSVRAFNPAISLELDALIAAAAARDRGVRVPSMEALHIGLNRIEEAERRLRLRAPSPTPAQHITLIQPGRAAPVDIVGGATLHDLRSPVAESEPRAPEQGTWARSGATLHDRGIWREALDRTKSSFDENDAHIVLALLQDLFLDVDPQADANLFALHGPLRELGEHSFFCLLMPERSNELGTAVFADSSKELERILKSLGAAARKIVLVVTSAPALGSGVRRKILDYRQAFNAWVLPLFVAELRAAHRRGGDPEMVRLFFERLTELHRPLDPFDDVGPKRDALKFVGMWVQRNELVAALHEPGPIVAISGLPGSGKSSLVNMAEYDSLAKFHRVRCASAADRTVDGLVAEICAVLRKSFGSASKGVGGLRNVEGQPKLRETLFAAVPESTKPGEVVLVLEDVDCLLEPLCAPASDARVECSKARAFWTTLAALCEQDRIGVLVTGVRTSLLKERRLSDWENPLATHVRSIVMDPFGEDTCARYVADTGLMANLRFEEGATKAVYEWSAGYIDIARAIGSKVFESKQLRSSNERFFEPTIVAPEDVRTAAAQLAGSIELFRNALSWLSSSERAVLDHVAAQRPRSVRALHRGLAVDVPREQTAEAMRWLARLGLVSYDRGRHRVRGALLERWLRLNAVPADLENSQRNIRGLLLGLTLTGTLLAIWMGLVVLHHVSRHPTTSRDGCIYEAFHDQYGIPGAEYEVTIRCQCEMHGTNIRLRAVDTASTFDKQLGPSEAVACDAQSRARRISIHLAEPTEGAQAATFALTDGHTDLLSFAIRSSPWIKAGVSLKTALAYLAAIPAAIGGIATFSKEFLAALRRLAQTFGLMRHRRRLEADAGPRNVPRSSG